MAVLLLEMIIASHEQVEPIEAAIYDCRIDDRNSKAHANRSHVHQLTPLQSFASVTNHFHVSQVIGAITAWDPGTEYTQYSAEGTYITQC